MVSLTASLAANNAVTHNTSSLAASQARLSSGQRITQASDDVAALAVGTSLNTQTTTLRSALSNASQASSLLQVANGGLDQQLSILEQQKALTVQASSGQLTDTDRAALDEQFQGLSASLTQLANTTSFNGVSLLNGSAGTQNFTLGSSGADSVSVTLGDTTANTLFNGQTLSVGTQSQAAAAADAIDQAITTLSSAQANVGATQSQIDASSNAITTSIQSQQAASSSLLETDVAAESTTSAAANILLQASISTQAHSHSQATNLLTLLQ